jgi:hypothetical protein
MNIIKPSRSLLVPTRRAFLGASAGLIAAPAIVRAGSMSLLGVGSVGSVAAFTPASLSGLIVWLKADAGVTLSGSNVTQWTDNKTAIAFTDGIGAGPTFSSTGFNSLPGLTFGASVNNSLVSGASALSFGASNNTGTFAAVVNFPTVNNACPLLSFLATGGSNSNSDPNSVDIRGLSAPSMQVVQNSGGFTNDNFLTATNYRMLWEFDGTNETSYFNNVLQSSSALNFNFGASGSGTGGLGIGDLNAQSDTQTVTIAEIVITKNALSSTDRANLDNYFKAKWSL